MRAPGWPVLVAAIASVALIAGALFARQAGVLPRWSDAKAELSAMDAEIQRRTEAEDRRASVRREIANLDEQIDQLLYVLPKDENAARERLVAFLRRVAAWSAEIESLEWSERVLGTNDRGDLRCLAGKARVRTVPGGWPWLQLPRRLSMSPQLVTVDCVEVEDLANPSSAVTYELTLYASAPENR